MGNKKNKTGLKVKKSKSKITFDEEIITKDDAANIIQNIVETHEMEILSNSSIKAYRKNEERTEHTTDTESKRKVQQTNNQEEAVGDLRIGKRLKKLANKRKRDPSKSKNGANNSVIDTEDALIESESKKKIRKFKQPTSKELEEHAKDELQEELNPMQPTINTTESLRKKKKKRHSELIDAKKLKTELNLQQNALNYLSKWKHTKDQWKFEKLTQVWIQNCLYDDAKLPDKIWTTVVEYFESAKGKVRNDIITKAVKLYEKENANENTNNIILNRAKDIIQSLSE